MPSVAEQLRQAREKQSLSVYEVADATKIKTDHVRALEEGDYRSFSAPIYIRGFVRSYAMVVKLDVPGILSQLDEELSENKRFRDPPSLTGESRGPVDALMLQLSKINWRIALPLAGIVLVLGLSILIVRAWKSHQERDPLVDLGPGIYQPSQSPHRGETLPLPR